MAATCPNCNKTVFFAEEVRAIGKSWHKRCLKCGQCNITLDAGSVFDRQGKVYCKNCYHSITGLKGFGHGVAVESSVSGGATGKATYANAPIDQESALGKGFSDGYQQTPTNPQHVHAPQVADVHTDPALRSFPHQQLQSEDQQHSDSHYTGPAFNPVVKPSTSSGGSYKLVNDGDWAYFDVNLQLKGSGHGAEALKKLLPGNECGFAYWRIVRANVGNAGQGVVTEANIVLQYKGPQTNAMKKVKSNNALADAQKRCPEPYKGFIEVITNGPNLSDNTIFDRWRPGSGSKVIDA